MTNLHDDVTKYLLERDAKRRNEQEQHDMKLEAAREATIRRLERERWRKRVIQIRADYRKLLDDCIDNACLRQMYGAVERVMNDLAKEMEPKP
jgi:hypothetical protein